MPDCFDHSLMGRQQGSAPSTKRIVILNVTASVKRHSRNVVQLGQEALCSQGLQKTHNDNKRQWAERAYQAYDTEYLYFPKKEKETETEIFGICIL